MLGIYCEVSKNSYDVKMNSLYILNDCEFDGGKLYSILYRIYGIKHMKILDKFEFEDESELTYKYTGYINLTKVWNEGIVRGK